MLNRLLAVLPLVLLAGCASARPAGPPPAPTPDARTIALVTRAGSDGADRQALDTAESRLAERCLTARGLPLELDTGGSTVDTDEEWKPDRARRRVHGYRIGESRSARTSPGPADRFLATLPATERQRYTYALYGPDGTRAVLPLPGGATFTYPTRGCLAEARTALWGDVATAARADAVPQVLWLRMYAAAKEAPAYEAAERRWSACMHGRGLPYADFAAARAAVNSAYAAGRDAREIPTALADADCAVAAGFPATVAELLRRQVAALAPTEQALLAAAAAARDAAVIRAHRVRSG